MKPVRSSRKGHSPPWHAGPKKEALATTSKSTQSQTHGYSRPALQYASCRSPVCCSRFARQCCAWQSEGCVPWRSRLWRRLRASRRSHESTARSQGAAAYCGRVQQPQLQRVTCAKCLAYPCGQPDTLRQPTLGLHFILGQARSAARRRLPCTLGRRNAFTKITP